jgi:ribosomal protein L7/L12
MKVRKCGGCGAPLTSEDGVCQFCGARNINDTVEAIEGKVDSFDVTLVRVGAKKINVIKIIREYTQLGLREAKNMADNAPSTLKQNISKSEAEEIKEQFETVGARVEIRAANGGPVIYTTPEDIVANAKEIQKSGCFVLLGVIGLMTAIMFFI